MIYAQRTYKCIQCGTHLETWRWDYEVEYCPQCRIPMSVVLPIRGASAAIVPDDIPGGLEIRHAICNPDGSPKRYYSKSEIRETARKAGWTIDGETPKPRENREV